MPIEEDCPFTQLLNTYIVATTNRGFILIHQQLAHERVLYERFLATAAGQSIPAQKSLFPATIEMSAQDAVLLADLMDDLNQLGYLIEPFGNNTFVVQGTPADVYAGNERNVLEKVLEQYKHFSSELKLSRREVLLRSVAWQQAIKTGTSLTDREMQNLIAQLFQCTQPNISPTGKPTYIEFKKDQLEKMFGR